MIFPHCAKYESHIVTGFHGKVGYAEIYDTIHTALKRDETAIVFDMDCEYRSELWEYPKRVVSMLGVGEPNHPILHAAKWVGRAEAPHKVFILDVGRVTSEALRPVAGTPVIAAKCVAQLIRSIAGMHVQGLAHGALRDHCWRMAIGGYLVLVDFGLMRPVGDELTRSDSGRALIEKDVRDLADLGLAFLESAQVSKQSRMCRILQNAGCQGFGGEFPSARLLFDAFAQAAAPVVLVDRGSSPADPLRLSPEEVRYLLQEFTRQSLVAAV